MERSIAQVLGLIAIVAMHHFWAGSLLIKEGYIPARDYLRDNLYGWPGE